MADDINNPYGGSIDDDIADLMGIDTSKPSSSSSAPGFSDLFGGPRGEVPEEVTPEDVDFSKQTFTIPGCFEAKKPNPVFSDKDYYKKALSNEGEAAQRVHKLLSDFMNAQDPKDRSLYRGKLTSAYWNLAESVIHKLHTDARSPKLYMIRFGLLLPIIVTPEQRHMLAVIPEENETGEPIHYVDEWLLKVARGQINPSATDETKQKKVSSGSKVQSLMEKAKGQRDIQIGVIRNRVGTLESCENLILGHLKTLMDHPSRTDIPELKEGYCSEQRRALSEMGNLLRELNNIDKELTRLYLEMERYDQNYKELRDKAKEEGLSMQVDEGVVTAEFNSVRQMAKLCVGRQGNHFPILMKQYFRANLREIATRENVIMEMARVEQIDPGVFKRTFKRETNRIVPNVILLPSYGERGVCWEPFEKFNRATSRGRVAIPLYPKNLHEAVVFALGDLRWQVAKEKAQHYWMEEGLTGHYYQWFSGRKMRGDVKEFFIQDYYLWITKESEGTQKLDREVRGIFWRHIPFTDELRESLKNRGFVYSELFKRDINRSMSDGY